MSGSIIAVAGILYLEAVGDLHSMSNISVLTVYGIAIAKNLHPSLRERQIASNTSQSKRATNHRWFTPYRPNIGEQALEIDLYYRLLSP